MKTKIIVADFGRGEQVVQHIKDEVGKLPIGILGMCNLNIALPVRCKRTQSSWRTLCQVEND